MNILGKTFNRLTIVNKVYKSGRYLWECKCTCGNVCYNRTHDIINNKVKSCGCYIQEKSTTHGMSKHPLYDIWIHMVERCANKKSKDYKLYGKRGITVSKNWMDINKFIKDMHPKPKGKYSIDRRNNNGPYSKDNCYWATDSEQANNKRTSRLIVFNNKRQTLKQWSQELGIKYLTLKNRLDISNMSIQTAFTRPIGRWL